MEAKAVISAMLRQFRLSSATAFATRDIPLLAEVVLRPKNGLQIMFSKRL